MTVPTSMDAADAARADFSWRVAQFYAVLFIPVAIAAPFFPLWLESIGFDAPSIGLVLSAQAILPVLTTPLIMAYADRHGERADVLTAVCWLTVLLAAGFLLPPVPAFVAIIAVALAVVWRPHAAFADAITISGVRRLGADYGHIRLWGSISFMLVSLVVGFLIDRESIALLPAYVVGTLVLTALSSRLVPRIGAPRRPSPLSGLLGMGEARGLLSNRRLALMLIAGGMIQSTHAMLSGFSSLYWSGVGISTAWIGALWAAGVVSEVAFFRKARRIAQSVSPETIVIIASGAAILRWLLFPLVVPAGIGVWGFVALQGFHGLTFAAAYMAVQQVIADETAEDRMGAAQGLNFLATSLLTSIVMAIGGMLYAAWGGWSYWSMIVVAVLAGLIAAASRRRQPQISDSGGETSEPT